MQMRMVELKCGQAPKDGATMLFIIVTGLSPDEANEIGELVREPMKEAVRTVTTRNGEYPFRFEGG